MPTARRSELKGCGAIGFLCLLPVLGCHPKMPRRLPPAGRGYSASVSLKIVKDGHRTRARGFVAVLPAKLLRLELHGPGGGTRLLLILQHGPSLLWVPGQAIYRGEGSRIVSRLLARELPVEDFIGALTGDVPAPVGLSVERTKQDPGKERIVLSMEDRLTVTMKLRRKKPIADASRLFVFGGETDDEERPIEALPSIWELVR